MQTPERDELLEEILSGESTNNLRERSLERTLTAVRRQRQWHNTLRGACVVGLVGLIVTVVWNKHQPSEEPEIAAGSRNAGQMETAKTVPGTSIRVINDDELLAMFPGRPVALVGPPQNRQFVLLDEKKLSKPGDKAPGHDHQL